MSKRDDILKQILSLATQIEELYYQHNDFDIQLNNTRKQTISKQIATLKAEKNQLEKKIKHGIYNFNAKWRRRSDPPKIFRTMNNYHNIKNPTNPTNSTNPNSTNTRVSGMKPIQSALTLDTNNISNNGSVSAITPTTGILSKTEQLRQQIQQLELRIRLGYSHELADLEELKKEYANLITQNGGGPLPLRYFDPNAYQSSASAGSDVLGVSGLEVRPKIGGKRTKRVTKRTRTTRRMKGGFIPSIMEPFIFGCSKYIAPLAALSGWKLINMPTNRKTKRVTRK